MKYDFAPDTRKALAMAREEAYRLSHDYVGTEHLLLALARLEGFLARFGPEPRLVVERLEQAVLPGRASPFRTELPYTSRAKKCLELAMAEARELSAEAEPPRGRFLRPGGTRLEPHHLLLGILLEEKGIGAQVLRALGMEVEEVRAKVRARATVVERRPGDGGSAAGQDEPPARREPGAARTGFRVVLDDASTSSIYEQIVAQVREAVATGALRPGERLPTVRTLADELDIAPGTVARAWAELERLGVVVTEGARGTRVADLPRPSGSAAHERLETLTGLLRPVAVAAFHLGGSAAELRAALEAAMKGILEESEGQDAA